MNKAISELLSKSTSEGSLIGVNCLVFKDGKELYSGSFGFADKQNPHEPRFNLQAFLPLKACNFRSGNDTH